MAHLFTALLSRGFFPRELPPNFDTTALGAHIGHSYQPPQRTVVSNCAVHTLPHASGVRRVLHIPNPASYAQICWKIASSWEQIATLTRRSRVSASRPMIWRNQERAIIPRYRLADRPLLRLRSRYAARYLVRTDISKFYHSIYTHSIPWVLHTKAVAKQQRNNDKLLGNQLDTLTRALRGRQSVGLPIGPDISLALSELVLSYADDRLIQRFGTIHGFRYVDDYEIAATTAGHADDILSELEQALLQLELHLNPRKTSIIELPHPIDEPWPAEIRRARLELVPDSITEYVSTVIKIASENPEQPVSRFSYMLLHDSLNDLSDEGWNILQSGLLNAASDDSAFPIAIELLLLGLHSGRPIVRHSLRRTITAFLERHAPAGHGNEVAWALWAFLAFNFQLDPWSSMNNDLRAVSVMEDDFVALLALNLNHRGLADFDTTTWEREMIGDNLAEGSHWLLAYEAFCKGWLGSLDGQDYIAADPFFSGLRSAGVQFYNEQVTAQPMTSVPRIARPFPGGSIATFYP